MSATMAPLVPALDDAARRGTGCLHVTGPTSGQQAQVYFDAGQVYAIHLHGFTPLVGRRLLSNGSLTTDQYATLLARANGNEHDPGIGVQAVKAGYFRQDVLDDVLEEILLAAFRELLSWDNPSTKFRRRARTTHLLAPAAPITTLLQASRRSGTQWQSWWAAAGFDPATVKPLAAATERDDDPDGVSRLLAVADGTLGLRAVAHACGLTYFEAGHAFLDLYNDGRVTFVAPTPKDPSMHPTLPVTHVAAAVDTVPGLPLPPLPNFDGQTLPPVGQHDGTAVAAAAQAVDLSAGQAGAQVEEQGLVTSATGLVGDPSADAAAPPHQPEAAQRVVSVDFDVAAALEAVESGSDDTETNPSVDAPATDADGDTGTDADREGEGDAALDASLVDEPTPEESDRLAPLQSPDEDPRMVAQRALLADELDAATTAVRLAEATIERLAAEERAHQEAAEQSVNHQTRYEQFLAAAEADRRRLLEEQQVAASEAEALAATAAEFDTTRASLGETVQHAKEQADAAALALQKAQAEHDEATLALHHAEEAAAEMAAMLADMTAAGDENRERVTRITEDLDAVEGRTRAYAQEIDEAKQAAGDLAEAAQASARLRERAQQRLAAAQGTLTAKEAQLLG